MSGTGGERPRVAVAVVPREGFGKAPACLERLIAVTSEPYELVYVDGGAPRRVRRRVEALRRREGFAILSGGPYLSPNEARNLVLARTAAHYVAFVDNDVMVGEGWLDALVQCAEETGAAFVSPLIGWKFGGRRTVHAAGGSAVISVENGTRRLHEELPHHGRSLEEARADLRRKRCSNAEFHCVLVRTEVARRVGGFDPALLACMEHVDFSLAASGEVGGGWFEPRAEVTYLTPGRLARLGPYFQLRWSRAWVDASLAHFVAKWGLEPDDARLAAHRRYLERHRWDALSLPRETMRRALGARAQAALDEALDGLVARTLVRRAVARRNVLPPVPGGAAIH